MTRAQRKLPHQRVYIPLEGQHLWEWFWELNTARTSNGWGANPIGYEQIQTWASLTGTITRPSEIRVLRAMDEQWMMMMSKKPDKEDDKFISAGDAAGISALMRRLKG